ncbi:gliding motility lipoprotein GldH [Roseivirga misakiensis]|uniref:Gliding motility lipoprotein GldH n=1 Tax=Roseivirga misakiensis TaxID=1563681 RepID=A0A1E5T514_9BACT|nr:gliding motility lipoprotein GldH [Roseivirga misakiensis]OEK06451.1 hypothetical protein BFP71_01880 [Roseivirga misakiensis]
MSKSIFGLLFVSLLFMMGCDSGRVYEADHDFEELTWNMDSIPDFQFSIEDTAPKDIIFKIRNSLDFPFRNCYMKYTLADTLGNTLKSELINLKLFDEKTGKPFGKGNSVFQHAETILSDYNFPKPGTYILSVAQYMRTTELAGTYSIGVRVEETSDY